MIKRQEPSSTESRLRALPAPKQSSHSHQETGTDAHPSDCFEIRRQAALESRRIPRESVVARDEVELSRGHGPIQTE